MLRSTWEHQHHDLASAKEECGKYPGVSVESLFLLNHSMRAVTCFRCGSCHVLLLRCPGTPFGMVCLFCGSLRHRARGPSERGFFSDLRSHLLVYSNRLRLLFATPLWPRALHPTTFNVPSCQLSHAPLFPSPILFLIFSHPHSIILLLVFFAPPPSLPPPPENLYIPIIEGEGGGKKKMNKIFQTSS